jgi:hypothetical protein
MALESTHPLTEINTRDVPGDKGRRARKAGTLTAICEPIMYEVENVGASTSLITMGFHGLLTGIPLTFF